MLDKAEYGRMLTWFRRQGIDIHEPSLLSTIEAAESQLAGVPEGPEKAALEEKLQREILKRRPPKRRRPAPKPRGEDYEGRSSLLRYKPADNRKNRPSWVKSEMTKTTIRHAIGEAAWKRYEVVTMYWQDNLKAKQIAHRLGISLNTVNTIIRRVTAKEKAERNAKLRKALQNQCSQ